eukprot:51235_1
MKSSGLWHKQYTSTSSSPTNKCIISLTLNTIETALRLNLAKKASNSLIDSILLSPFGSSIYTFTSTSKHSKIIQPCDILSNINRYKLSFQFLDFIQNNTEKINEIFTTINNYTSKTKEP